MARPGLAADSFTHSFIMSLTSHRSLRKRARDEVPADDEDMDDNEDEDDDDEGSYMLECP